MPRILRLWAFLALFCSIAATGRTQTGLYPFGSFEQHGLDTINRGNLNVHFEIPLVTKPGRGLSFNYVLGYDGLVWSRVSNYGSSYWSPDPSWGFHGQLGEGFTGYMTEQTSNFAYGYCPSDDGSRAEGYAQFGFTYHDPYGQNHVFNYMSSYCSTTDETTFYGDGTSDSGYTLVNGFVQDLHGNLINAPYMQEGQTASSLTDSNGNTISRSGSGAFTDTTGTNVLNITGGGSASSPRVFTYPVVRQSNNSNTAAATIYYHTYTVQTNFGVSGTSEYGPVTVDLVDHATLPDQAGSTYYFTYETTPGSPTHVTGRLASITLPTGGTIAYSYTAGSNGINPDGTPSGLTRTTSDGTRYYTRGTINANATSTTIQDELSKQTYFAFTVDSDSNKVFETHRQVYEGNTSAAILQDQYTCYNGATANCDGTAITLPITEVDTTNSFNGGTQTLTQNAYSTSGLLTSTSLSGVGSTTYNYSSLGNVQSITSYDAASNQVSYATYGYDESPVTATSGVPSHMSVSGARGNLTSTHTFVAGTTLHTSTLYYDTGMPVSTTSPGGFTTSYGYDSTQTFVTQTTLPTPSSGVAMASTASYDPASGGLLTSTGLNSGQTSTVNTYDGTMHALDVTLPNGGHQSISISNPNHSLTYQDLGSGQTPQVATVLDSYGRVSRVAYFNGQTTCGSGGVACGTGGYPKAF